MPDKGMIAVNDNLVVFLDGDEISIGRDDGGLVTIPGDELKPLLDTVARLLVSPKADIGLIDKAAQANALAWAISDVLKLREQVASLTECVAAKNKMAYLWKRAAKEWRVQSQDLQSELSRIPIRSDR